MIVIRTDANKTIATGHLMRCISIASELKKRNQEVLFVISEKDMQGYIEESGFEFICLENSYKDKDNEIEMLMNVLANKNVKMILVDSYEALEKYIISIKEKLKIKVAYIDDLKKTKYNVDFLINYTLGVDEEEYKNLGYNEQCELLLGSGFTPLRKQFDVEKIAINKQVKTIYITTGGTDNYHVISKLLTEMKQAGLSGIKKKVVIGKFYEQISELKELQKTDSNIEIFQNVSEVAKIMKSCDLAISAGGTTLAELCACGVPTIAFTIAENQMPGVKSYSSLGALKYAGDISDKKMIRNIITNIELLSKDMETRSRMSEVAKSVVDGKGASRIADGLINNIK